jgi:chemotaxis protein histidine kinase CheA
LSEDFLRVATKELCDDLLAINDVLSKCSSDSDVFKLASEIKTHLHKMKGLAPMMNQVEIGELASILDRIFNSIVSGISVAGIYNTLKASCQFMHDKLDNKSPDYDLLKTLIRQQHGQFVL